MQGYKRPLEEKDLWSLNAEDKSQRVVPQLVRRWDKECSKVKRSDARSYYLFKILIVYKFVVPSPYVLVDIFLFQAGR